MATISPFFNSQTSLVIPVILFFFVCFLYFCCIVFFFFFIVRIPFLVSLPHSFFIREISVLLISRYYFYYSSCFFYFLALFFLLYYRNFLPDDFTLYILTVRNSTVISFCLFFSLLYKIDKNFSTLYLCIGF